MRAWVGGWVCGCVGGTYLPVVGQLLLHVDFDAGVVRLDGLDLGEVGGWVGG